MRIKAFYYKGKGSSWVELPETSDYLHELSKSGVLPVIGDVVTLVGKDGVEKLNLSEGSFEHICTVKQRWFNHGSAAVAIVLEYVVF